MKGKTSHLSVTSLDRKRLVFIAFFLFVLFCCLIIKFYRIQILEGDKWTKVANRQHRHTIIEPFMRGSFYSNTSIKKGHPENEQPFVMDVPKFHLFIDPKSLSERQKEKIIEKLTYFFSLKQNDKKKISSHFYRKSRSRKVLSWLDPKVKEELEKWWFSFAKEEKIPKNVLYFALDYKRSYPFGSLLGQLLHTVQDRKDERTFQGLPTGGLEMQFNEYLKGKLGKKIFYRSPRHPLEMGKILECPENGADVFLTINHYLQAICEQELKKGIKDADAIGGWVVMMDPYTGEILALAQYPFFDPVKYRDYFNDPNKQEHTRVKAVSDAFEPGSIFKAVMMAIGLLANEEMEKIGKKPLFNPEEKFPTSDGSFPKTCFTVKDGRRHNFLNMYLALQKSSNVYPGKVIQKVVENLGEDWLRDALVNKFGFGQYTGIEIPAETPGLVPTPGKLHPNGKPEWSVPTPYCLSMGHNILINSMQILRFFAIIANGGLDVKPTILRKIIKKQEDTEITLVDNIGHSKQGRRILSKKSSSMLTKAMKYVTKLGGSAPRGDIYGYTEAGKSGTSEKIINGKYSDKKYIASFVGFAPANNPRFVLLVTLDEPEKKFVPGIGKNHHGGISASPIFRAIGTRVFPYLGVSPDDPHGVCRSDPRYNSEKADWVKENTELRELYKKWNGCP